MKPTLRATIVLLVILLLGIGIGFEIGEILFRKHFEEMEAFRGPQGFVNKFDDLIKPDADQKAKVDSILMQHHQKLDQISQNIRTELDKQMDSMKAELKPLLRDDQYQRLINEFNRMKNPQRHGPHGPGDMPHGPDGMPPPPHGDGPHGEGPHGEPPAEPPPGR